MIISSELTGKTYKTVEECLAAEREYKLQKEEEEKAREEHQKAKDEAYKRAIEACDEYLRLCGVEVDFNDNGYRVKVRGNDRTDKIFEDILNAWLN